MEHYQGDLNDIVRGSGGPMGCVSASDQASNTLVPSSSCWQQLPSDPLNFPASAMEDHRLKAFGDPFSTLRDPLLHELNVAAAGSSSTFFNSSPNSTDHMINNSVSTPVEDTSNFPGAISNHSKIFEDDIRSSPCNIFSRIQISRSSSDLPMPPSSYSTVMTASVSPRGIKAPAVLPGDIINANATSKSCLIDNSGPVQISSPPNLGIKRRKSQAKKVVCIPAPASASSRSSGEVVPSDLWAWRKYGQKPIKGSPYPRGYYRCSSSKGCSARKQVERSRTDPNMLVITYTSDHNHPWPTQRNALAGSTRSHHTSKNNASVSKISSPSSERQNTTVNPKEELKEISSNVAPISPASASVKDEIGDMEKQLHIVDVSEFGDGIPQTYRPALLESHQPEDNFFAALDEIEADPLSLLFPQGFNTDQNEQEENKSMDPFSLFDWSGDDNNSSF